ncbi:MAG: DNA-binding beta-propeller fold protein YncE/DNA-binding beta-propeller fold protein YncE, partial [Verrucomicrobia bacterium]
MKKHSILASALWASVCFANFCPSLLFAQKEQESVRWPGRQPDGSVLLPNMWSLRPAGVQVEVADFPVNIAMHPEGKFAAVLHAGHSAHEIQVLDIAGGKIVQTVNVAETFYGLEFSQSGKRLYASGASHEVIRCFNFDREKGELGAEEQIVLRDSKERGIPSGLALSSDAQSLYVANVLGQNIAKVDLSGKKAAVVDIAFGASAAPNVVTPPKDAAARTADEAAITKRAEAALDLADPAAPYPYACRLDERRNRLYVSLWAQAEVAVIDLKTNGVVARWKTEEHPNEMLLSKNGKLLYVANAHRNTVSVIDTETGLPTEVIWAALHPQSPPGATPNSLALSPDEKTLFIANANINTLAVCDVSVRGKSRSLGFIPTGWYPTSVRVTPDGKRLLVANGKGSISKANPKGPQPGVKAVPGTVVEYIGSLFKGTISILDLPARAEFETRLEKYTAEAYRCSPLLKDNAPVGTRPKGNPIPGKLGDPSPIKHCIYIVKENRTYDQVFGDMKEGNGDASLCLFPERSTPNHHKLARSFVLLDNFYVESEVSADGHEWSMAAYASDYVEKFWPLNYGHNKSRKYAYPSEGNFPIATPAGGYLWDRAAEAGVSFRSYGEFVQNGKTPEDPCKSRVKSLQGRFDPAYRSFDMDYPDVKRAERFISELQRFEKEGEMPRLQVVRLPQDHTAGTTPGKWTPTACVADNDLALGMLVEAVSKSKFWASTAIFVVEDDAQNGPDHVDAHRTVALAISPYTRRGTVDSTMYSTSSMLRSMELILGMRPMSQFDAAATPMYKSFQSQADVRPFVAVAAKVDTQEVNSSVAWGAGKSRKLDFSKEDAADDLVLNEIIWRSVRGAASKMPAPVRAAFVFAA